VFDERWAQLAQLAPSGLLECWTAKRLLGVAHARLHDAFPGARQRQAAMNVVSHDWTQS
jgi:hypothetical protein